MKKYLAFIIKTNTYLKKLSAKFNKKITIHSFETNIQFLNSLKKSAIKNQFDINLNNFALTDSYKQLNFDGYAIKSKKSKFLIQGKRLEKYIKEKKNKY